MGKTSRKKINVELGSDQTSLHNPWAGGYYPVGMSFENANNMMVNNPEEFKKEVQKTLIRHTKKQLIPCQKEVCTFLIMEMLFY